MKSVYIFLCVAAIAWTGCTKLDQQPFDSIGEVDAFSTDVNVEAVTLGQYANMKDQITIRGQKYWWSLVPRTYEIFTLQGDDAIYAQTGGASDIFGANSYTYPLNGEFNRVWYTVLYRNIGVCNNVIDNVQPSSLKKKQLVAENRFLRAVWYLRLARLYAKPYTHGRSNPGVVLRLHNSSDNMPRATVGEVYDQIVTDLLASIDDLPGIATIKDHGRASKEAAWAYLSSVFAWMTDPVIKTDTDKKFANDAIKYATLVINSGTVKLAPTAEYFGSTALRDPKTPTGTPVSHYYSRAKTSLESILVIARTDIEALGKQDRGALWIDDNKASGWGQIYASENYRKLLDKNLQDLRHNFIEPHVYKDANGNVLYNPNGSLKVYQYRNNQYAEEYFVNKFSYQAGNLTMASEVMMRMAEVILNRAEAYAKLADAGQTAADGHNPTIAAIEDVNSIRARAGLTGTALYNPGSNNGYGTYLDLVLDERKLELAWDLNRAHDIFRNKHNLTNRTFNGAIVNVPWTDSRVPYQFPQVELDLNPLLKRN